MEEWKIYKKTSKTVWEISNEGNVKKNGIIVDVIIGKNGYAYSPSHELVHRLVALNFIPNPENKPCVDHIDTNPLNNHYTNLRWVTHSENMLNPITRKRNSESQKRVQSGENNGMFGKNQKQSTKDLIAIDHHDRMFINNGNVEKFIKKDELDNYLNSGYTIGRLPFNKNHIKNMSDSAKNRTGKNSKGNIIINNGITEKRIFPDELNYYIKLGWVKGRKIFINNHDI